MARKPKLSNSSRPTAQQPSALETAPTRKGGQLVTVPGDGDNGMITREPGVALVSGQSYQLGDHTVVAEAYYIGDHPKDGRNGRLGEADKLAWRDPASGYECIMMRKMRGGPLGGYVAVPRGHPLFGFEADAVPPDLEIEVHGGLSYSAICDEGPSPSLRLIDEAQRICHVRARAPRYAQVEHATDYRAGGDTHEQAWWFGFECNQVYDAVPSPPGERARFLKSETGAVIRDEAYVCDQVVDLAAQLRAIGDGRPKPKRTGMAPPPLGLDPSKAR